MDQSLVTLIAACIAFVGTHFALSHPLRALTIVWAPPHCCSQRERRVALALATAVS